MDINVITVRSGWILQKIAERIVAVGNKTGLGDFTLSHRPKMGVDVNFYCDVQNCYFGPTSAHDIGLFTHIHADDVGTVAPHTFKLDYIFHMAERYMKMFESVGYNSRKMNLMVPWEAHSSFELKKPLMGIFQRGKYQGKGFDRMMRLADWPVTQKYRWAFLGNDWTPVVHKLRANGCEVTYHVEDSALIWPQDYSSWYKKVDYVFIPSEWEGGPISALEAYAHGCEIISSDVGWVRERLGGWFVYKDDEALKHMLDAIILGAEERVRMVKDYSYRRCAEQIIEAAEKL